MCPRGSDPDEGPEQEGAIGPRVLEPELMDDPGLDRDAHADALRGLARINRVSFAARAHLAPLRAAAAGLGRPVRVLDVATGSGDVAVSVAVLAARLGIDTELILADVSPVAVEAARARARAAGIAARAEVLDAIVGPLPAADLVLCSLFLHHLDESGVVRLLSNVRASGSRRLSVSDLRRCAAGTALARTVPRVLTRSYVVHTDAVRSARAAWTVEELRDLAGRAGLVGAVVRACFPCRMRLDWEAPA